MYAFQQNIDSVGCYTNPYSLFQQRDGSIMNLICMIGQGSCRYEYRTVVGYQFGGMRYTTECITALLFFDAIQAGQKLAGIVEIKSRWNVQRVAGI